MQEVLLMMRYILIAFSVKKRTQLSPLLPAIAGKKLENKLKNKSSGKLNITFGALIVWTVLNAQGLIYSLSSHSSMYSITLFLPVLPSLPKE